MNALDRLSRAVAVASCVALVGAAVPHEALARVVARVPVQSAPVGVPAAGSARVSVHVSAPALSLAAPSLGLASDPEPVVAPAPVVDRPGALDAPEAILSAPSADAPVEHSIDRLRDAPEAGEFKAEAGACAVADAPAIARGFAALKRLFTTRSAGESLAPGDFVRAAAARAPPPAALAPAAPAAGDGNGAPPAPPSEPERPGDSGKGGILGMGLPAVAFIGALLVAQIGVEAMGNAMPVLVQQVFGSFTVVAQIAIFSSIAGIVGRQLAPVVIQRHGLRKVYLATEALRMVSITAMLALLATGHMTLPAMMAFYSVNGLFGGVAVTAETSIPPALVGQDDLKLQRFWTWEQTLLEIIGIIGPIVAGSAVDAYGAAKVLIAYPAAFLAAMAILFLTLRIPAKLELMRMADLEKARGAPALDKGGSIFGQFFQRIARGARLVWSRPLLRYAFVGYSVYMMLNPFLYSIIAPAYGLLVGGQAGMGGVFGTIAGLYSLGGLLGGLYMAREQSRIDKAQKDGTMTSEQVNESLRKSMIRMMLWTIPTLAAFATVFLPNPAFLSALAVPYPFIDGYFIAPGTVTLLSLALIPFGFAQVISTVKLRSYFQAKVPDAKDMADAMGFFGSASLIISTIGLQSLSWLFQHAAGLTPFLVFAGLMAPLAAYFLYLSRRLDRSGRAP